MDETTAQVELLLKEHDPVKLSSLKFDKKSSVKLAAIGVGLKNDTFIVLI